MHETDVRGGLPGPAEGLAELRGFIREHHVYFEVRPELVPRPGERLKVGFELWLWAVHHKGEHALPGCARCRTLAHGLERLARTVLPPDDREARCALEPFRPALYESRVVQGADEICVVVRLFHGTEYERPVDACEERCLKEIRQGLRSLGAREI